MGTQPLSDRTVRRVSRRTGLVIAFGAAHGGYTYSLVTVDHRHAWYDLKTGEWGWEAEPFWCFTTCRQLFPGQPPVVP